MLLVEMLNYRVCEYLPLHGNVKLFYKMIVYLVTFKIAPFYNSLPC